MELRRRARSGEHDTIDGLSAATMARIRRIEVLHPRMYPGFTGDRTSSAADRKSRSGR